MALSSAALLIAGIVVVSAAPSTDTGFIGRSTDLLTTSILQVGQRNATNYVFSPLGYSTLLAMMAEGAVGPTRDQIAALLQLPEDTYTVRTSYRALLAPMQERGMPNQPEFKSWFYTKKNITLEDGFKTILEENYFTEVKEIDNSLSSPQTNGTSVEPESTTAREPSSEERNRVKAVEQEIIQSFSNNRLEEAPKVQTVVIGCIFLVFGERFRSFRLEEDVALKAVAEDNEDAANDAPEDHTELRSKVICFNALFFEGTWADNFTDVANGCAFETASGPVKANCIQSTGDFEMARIPQLKAEVLQIPYQGGRYSLFIILPENDQKLEEIISKLSTIELSTINKQLTKRTMKILIPKFKFFTISKPKEAVNQQGVEDIYSPTMADLSGITGNKQLYLSDLVQFVSMDISKKSASYNFLTATGIASLRTAIPEFHVNRPFLFFLKDRIDNYVLVAGKLENPNAEK